MEKSWARKARYGISWNVYKACDTLYMCKNRQTACQHHIAWRASWTPEDNNTNECKCLWDCVVSACKCLWDIEPLRHAQQGCNRLCSSLDLDGPPTFARPQDHAVLEKLSAFNGRNHPAESASKVDSVDMLQCLSFPFKMPSLDLWREFWERTGLMWAASNCRFTGLQCSWNA